MRTHGLASTYRAGCRCEECTAAHTEWAAEKRAARATRPTEQVPHGLGGYKNWGCRCDVCCAAQSEANAAYRARAGGAA